MALPKLNLRITRLLFAFIIISTVSYIFLNRFIDFLVHDISFQIQVKPTSCDSIWVYINSSSTPILVNKVNANLTQSFNIPLLASTKSLAIYPCLNPSVTIQKMQLLYKNKSIEISSSDNTHIHCHNCANFPGSDNSSPGPPLLEVNKINDFFQLVYKNSVKLIYRLPLLIIIAFFMLIIINLAPLNLTQVLFIINVLAISIFFGYHWHDLQTYFPPATYTSNRILAFSQYTGNSLQADIILVLTLLSLLLICGIFRNFLSQKFQPLFTILLLSLLALAHFGLVS